MKEMRLRAECDGSGNSPRGSSCAAILIDEHGEILLEKAKILETGTNNIAEYSGVLLAIEGAIELEADELEIFSDSQLIVNQINETYDVKKESLLIYRNKVWSLAKLFDSISINWFPREKNQRADHLCRVILDEHSPKGSDKSKKRKREKSKANPFSSPSDRS